MGMLHQSQQNFPHVLDVGPGAWSGLPQLILVLFPILLGATTGAEAYMESLPNTSDNGQ
jgi:hypothetical protein